MSFLSLCFFIPVFIILWALAIAILVGIFSMCKELLKDESEYF